MTRLFKFAVLICAFSATSASAAVYCDRVGVPKGCVARPAAATPGVGAPGVGVRPGVGVGAPGVGAVDPGINQPGAAGNVGAAGAGAGAPGVGVEPGNRGGPVDRPGRR